jgi:hypothetical protein
MTNQLYFHQQWDSLYNNLVQQLASYETTATDEKKWIEWGFSITTKTWFSIQQKIESYQFANLQEEIIFYKTLKPNFIALMDFFTLLYKSVLFQPDDKAGKKKYWQGELKTCKTFLSRHKSICQYYEQGNTGMDHVYFVQQNNQQPLILGINENNWRRAYTATISYSHQLARVISIKKYQHYVQDKIGNASASNSTWKTALYPKNESLSGF